jgi:soluble lytic murein transglycosylase-like protein
MVVSSAALSAECLTVLTKRRHLMVNMLITLYSAFYGINSELSFQVARIESGMNPLAISRTNDGGLYQLNRKYHKFHNPDLIFDINYNIPKALYTLKELKKACSHKLNNTYVLCYNMGIRGAKNIKHPLKHRYYKKTNLFWRL